MKKLCKLFIVFVAGAIGGCCALFFMGWLQPYTQIKAPNLADAVTIANTYIVFTTFMFVGFTVVLGLAGYAFAQQFSKTKEAHEINLINELKVRLKEDDILALELTSAIMENEAVNSKVAEKLESKAIQLFNDKLTEYEFDKDTGDAEIADDLTTEAGS